MRFETAPQLIITKDEFTILNNALKLCQDMDKQTSESCVVCLMCPFQKDCSYMCKDCTYTQACNVLEKIINIAIVE